MKNFLLSLFLLLSLSGFGQRTVTLTADLVLTETLVITEDTRYEGNGFAIVCEGCKPAIKVENSAEVHFENIRFHRGYRSWMQVTDGAKASWHSNRMTGHILSTR